MNISQNPKDPSQTNPWREWIKKKGWDLPDNQNKAGMDGYTRFMRLIEESEKAEFERALAKMYFEAQERKRLQRKSETGGNHSYSALAKTAAELGREAGAAAASKRMMATSSPQYGSQSRNSGTLDTSRAPRPSDSYLRAPQLRPASYYQPRPAMTSEPRYLVVDDLANLTKTGYYTAQFLGDWADDLFHKSYTAAGKTLGILIADAIGKIADAPKTYWSKEDYLGGVWDRKPMAGRGLGAYLDAKRKGEDPSEWFAHAEDADFLYDWNPETTAGEIAKVLSVNAFNAASPSSLAAAILLSKLNAKFAKNFKTPKTQEAVNKGLGAVQNIENAWNKWFPYR